MKTPLVLIVGAGPSGITTAIELRRFGLDVRIIDRSDHPALHSQALVVQARTLEQLQRYGIAAAAIAIGRKLTRGEFFSEGKQILSIDLGKISSRYPFALFLPQSETEAMLNRHMESLGVQIERETELVGIEPVGSSQSDQATVAALLRHADGSQERVEPRWLVGCDGAHSVVRQRSGIPFEGAGIALSFFLGDLELAGPDAPADALSIHLHRGNVVVLGRLSDKFTRVIVALHSRQQDSDPKRDLTLRDFQDPIDEAGIRVKILSAKWMTPFNVNDRQASHYRKGNLFLVGDAAHIHSPVGGQGMNTGMQDAANLAWKLAAVAYGANDHLLDSYGEEREAVGKALLSFTERGLKIGTSANPFVASIRDALLPHLAGWHTVQKKMLGFISETAIEYRSSGIIADHGGDGSLRAGDRMPDIHIGEEDHGSALLEAWTEADHLAILLNATDEEAANMAASFAAIPIYSLHGSDLDDEGRRLLGADKKLLLIRPDGYVGFRSRLNKPDELQAYMNRVGMIHSHFDHKQPHPLTAAGS